MVIKKTIKQHDQIFKNYKLGDKFKDKKPLSYLKRFYQFCLFWNIEYYFVQIQPTGLATRSKRVATQLC